MREWLALTDGCAQRGCSLSLALTRARCFCRCRCRRALFWSAILPPPPLTATRVGAPAIFSHRSASPRVCLSSSRGSRAARRETHHNNKRYQRLAETGANYGIPSEVLSPADAQRVHPLLAVDDVYGALHSPTDGTIDAAGIVTAYAKASGIRILLIHVLSQKKRQQGRRSSSSSGQ